MWSVVVNGLAGAGGSIIAQIITYPLQTYRLLSHPAKNSSNTRLQSAHSPHFLVMSGAGEHPAADREVSEKKKAGSGGSDASTLYQML
ncbi:hypothetical protein D1007_40218 [Hordeum vulgare]|nr:hypothetical protein D1007_40218 [Hordeum vulgare]